MNYITGLKNCLLYYLYNKCTLPFKTLRLVSFKCFWSLFCSTTLHLFSQKYSKNSNIVKYYYNLNNCFLYEYIVKCNLFLWCKAEFSASLLQSSVSHDPSEIILLLLKKHLFLLSMLKTVVLLIFLFIYLETQMLIHFPQDVLMNSNFVT